VAALPTETEELPINSADEHASSLPAARGIGQVAEVREISAEDRDPPARIARAAEQETWRAIVRVVERAPEISEEPIGLVVVRAPAM
jgi:hypothetical protein